MAIREYKCPNCGFTTEIILPISKEPSQSESCKRCGGVAEFVQFSNTSFTRSSFQEAPIDLKVGLDAEKRWKNYHDRQEKRNTIRQETQSMGLTATGYNDYKPVSEENKELRENVAHLREENKIPDPDFPNIT